MSDLQTSPIKGQMVDTLGFGGHIVFISTIQLYHCSVNVAIGNMLNNGHGTVSPKIYLHKLWEGRLSFADPCCRTL